MTGAEKEREGGGRGRGGTERGKGDSEEEERDRWREKEGILRMDLLGRRVWVIGDCQTHFSSVL